MKPSEFMKLPLKKRRQLMAKGAKDLRHYYLCLMDEEDNFIGLIRTKNMHTTLKKIPKNTKPATIEKMIDERTWRAVHFDVDEATTPERVKKEAKKYNARLSIDPFKRMVVQCVETLWFVGVPKES